MAATGVLWLVRPELVAVEVEQAYNLHAILSLTDHVLLLCEYHVVLLRFEPTAKQ